MKFSQMPYVRPNLEELKALAQKTVSQLDTAGSAAEQADIYYTFEKAEKTTETMSAIAYIRHSIDTRDAFYTQEQDWMDQAMPQFEELRQQVNLALLRSPYRAELSAILGELLFTNLEIAVRSFKPELMPLMAEENKLVSDYQKLYASAMVEFDGKTMPLPMLGPYKQSTDRAVRKAAYETEGRFFDAHRQELDSLYDQLVKNRTAQGKLMGYDNFIPLGYDRMNRNCYGPAKVAAFREQVVRDLVPVVCRVKQNQLSRLGLEQLSLYDDNMRFADGNATPVGTADDILKAGLEMYHGLSPQTGEFIDFLYENELLDVLSKPGKGPGGYCSSLPDYQAPFIFSNFNGTSADVDILTHEAGHAFADYRAARKGYIRALQSPTMEACECHSMSMEFLTQDFHKLFFGENTRKYEISHCEDSLSFIPYGCMVDEFQHRVYENPDLTPEERNGLWMDLEKKYRPWLDLEALPFYGRGAGWQRQLHIYLMPFYYIDYCMAQTVALQFWIASMADREGTWNKYLAFTDFGGSRSFEELVRSVGLEVPYEDGCVGKTALAVEQWLKMNTL
ncbi:MAG: M3 family oligoendopeptidase [Oscillospiraceae bacterium]|nr:M3 family oligoendopeptidase [Oscillospiraceae bacterium]